MTKKRSEAYEQRNEITYPKPTPRDDGELYKRPPVTAWEAKWAEGYDDGFAGMQRRTMENLIEQDSYNQGYAAGEDDRREVQASGSSNT